MFLTLKLVYTEFTFAVVYIAQVNSVKMIISHSFIYIDIM